MSMVKTIMKKDFVKVSADISLEELSRILIKNTISGAPVVNRKTGVLIGFVSERDIIKALANDMICNKVVIVSQVMNKNVVYVSEDTSVEKLSNIFAEHPFRYIPVVKNKKIIGIVSRKEIINKLMGYYY